MIPFSTTPANRCTIYSNKPGITVLEWREIWLRRFSSLIEKECIPEETAAQYLKIIGTFLEKNPKAPKFIPLDGFIRCLAGLNTDALEAILLFYKEIKDTEKYLLEIERMKLLNKLSNELKLKNYTDTTQINYYSIVRNFLHRLSYLPMPESTVEPKQYILYLKDHKKNAPSTINLASAALSFFYS